MTTACCCFLGIDIFPISQARHSVVAGGSPSLSGDLSVSLQQKVKGLQWVESEGDPPATTECRACDIGKHRKKSIPRKQQQAVAFGDRVHGYEWKNAKEWIGA